MHSHICIYIIFYFLMAPWGIHFQNLESFINPVATTQFMDIKLIIKLFSVKMVKTSYFIYLLLWFFFLPSPLLFWMRLLWPKWQAMLIPSLIRNKYCFKSHCREYPWQWDWAVCSRLEINHLSFWNVFLTSGLISH